LMCRVHGEDAVEGVVVEREGTTSVASFFFINNTQCLGGRGG
jgi:hypothetical protein